MLQIILLSKEECHYLLIESQKQAIDSVMLEDFIRFKPNIHSIQEYQKIKMQWIANTLRQEQRNKLANLRAKQLYDFLRAEAIEVVC